MSSRKLGRRRACPLQRDDGRVLARYRRDVPEALLDTVIRATGLTNRDCVLDLGCGTGQLAVPLARHAGSVLALDPEPDMLAGLRDRLDAQHVPNVVPILAADRDLDAIAALHAGSLAALTVANALHWMDAELVVRGARELLRPGGALVIVTQGPPLWLGDTPWSRAVRAFLREWTAGAVAAACGTDRETREQRAAALRSAGFAPVEVATLPSEHEVDLDYVSGHLRSAMSGAAVAPHRRVDFDAGLREALGPHLTAGPLIERIDATAIIAISHSASAL